MNDALTRLCPNKAPSVVGSVAFGTDTNSLVKLPRPRGRNSITYSSAFPKSRTGSREWDYNTEGVAHYGMFADFIQDVRTAPANRGISGAALVDDHLFRSADYFWRMWQRIEAQAKNVR